MLMGSFLLLLCLSGLLLLFLLFLFFVPLLLVLWLLSFSFSHLLTSAGQVNDGAGEMRGMPKQPWAGGGGKTMKNPPNSTTIQSLMETPLNCSTARTQFKNIMREPVTQ